MKTSLHEYLLFGGKIPRKIKKRVIGLRMNKRTIKTMIRETLIGEPIKTMYERRNFEPHGAFCPNCGKTGYIGTGNKTQYPEHWEYFHCIGCRKIVGYIDNSPFIHALECSENNYNPVF